MRGYLFNDGPHDHPSIRNRLDTRTGSASSVRASVPTVCRGVREAFTARALQSVRGGMPRVRGSMLGRPRSHADYGVQGQQRHDRGTVVPCIRSARVRRLHCPIKGSLTSVLKDASETSDQRPLVTGLTVFLSPLAREEREACCASAPYATLRRSSYECVAVEPIQCSNYLGPCHRGTKRCLLSHVPALMRNTHPRAMLDGYTTNSQRTWCVTRFAEWVEATRSWESCDLSQFFSPMAQPKVPDTRTSTTIAPVHRSSAA